MDTSVNGIAALSTAMANAKAADAVGVSVLKKAMQSERAGALALIQALPPIPPAPSAGRVGSVFSASA